MPGPAHAAKTRILSATYGLLYSHGFARVSMDAIATKAGVAKRTLYYHFDSKDALVAAVLMQQHHHALARIRSWAKGSARTPAEYLDDVFHQVERWASEPKWLGSGFTRLTAELADLPGHPARGAARQHKLEVEKWLAGELTDLGARRPEELARQVMLLIEGSLSLVLIHGTTTYFTTAAQAAKRLADAEVE